MTAAIIVGLLAMHSLNTHGTTTGHASAATASSVATDASSHHDAPAAANPAGAAADASGCADCGDDHAMAWMACVLALLVSVILLARVRIGWRTAARDGVLRAVRARWPASAPYRPTALSHCSLHQSHVMTRPPASHTGNASSARQSSRRITDLERTSP